MAVVRLVIRSFFLADKVAHGDSRIRQLLTWHLGWLMRDECNTRIAHHDHIGLTFRWARNILEATLGKTLGQVGHVPIHLTVVPAPHGGRQEVTKVLADGSN